VTEGSPASVAGIAPGDEVMALQGLRVTVDDWQTVFRAVAATGRPLEVLLARRGVIVAVTATPKPGPGKVSLEFDERADEATRSRRDAWLPSPTRTGATLAP
jgi:predicted metalloprotease with PDZ domain